MKRFRVLPCVVLVFAAVLASCTPRTAESGKTDAAASGAAASGAALDATAAPASVAEAGPCTLVYAEGVVTMDGKPIEPGTVIIDGALVQTDASGLAELVFNDKNIIRMGPKASMRLEMKTLQRVVNIESGKITAVLRKLDKLAGGTLEVRTPNAVAGVRGTSLCAWYRPGDAQTYFCTCNGTLHMEGSEGSLTLEKTAPHHDPTVFLGEAGSTVIWPIPAGFDMGHTDKDLDELAARIGETIDWTVAE